MSDARIMKVRKRVSFIERFPTDFLVPDRG